MLRLLIVWSLLLAAQATVSAETPLDQNLLTQQASFFDASGTMDFEQVRQATFQAIQDEYYVSAYNEGASWFRFVVLPSPNDAPLFLQIRPNNRNELILYEPTSRGAWKTQITGNSMPWSSRATYGKSLGFDINPKVPTTYYMRMKTHGIAFIDIRVLNPKQRARSELISTLMQMMYVALLMAAVAWATQQYVLRRDHVVLAFTIAHALYLVMVLALWGYLAPLWPNTQSMDHIVYWLVTATQTALLIFIHLLCRQLGFPRWQHLTTYGLLFVNAAGIVLMLSGAISLGLKVNASVIVLWGILAFAGSMFRQSQGGLSKRMGCAYFGLFLVGAWVHYAPTLEIFAAPVITLNGGALHALTSLTLMWHLLHLRALDFQRQDQARHVALQLANQEVIWQKNRMTEQELFMSMLTHELRNPLASIRLTMDALLSDSAATLGTRHQRINRAVQEIENLVKRCVLADAIDQGRVELTIDTIEVTDLIRNVLTGFPYANQFQIDIAPDLPALKTDIQLLEIAISNLMENALKYAPTGSPINIVCALHSPKAFDIQIINELGPNSTPDATRIFEKYHRGQQVSGRNGAGIGLFLVRWIAQRLGGQISMLPLDKHICFQLWIPLDFHKP